MEKKQDDYDLYDGGLCNGFLGMWEQIAGATNQVIQTSSKLKNSVFQRGLSRQWKKDSSQNGREKITKHDSNKRACI